MGILKTSLLFILPLLARKSPLPPSLPIHRWLRTPTFCQTLRLLLTIWLMPSVLSSRSMRTLVVSLPCHPPTAPVATAARLQSCNAGIPPALRLRVPWTFGTTLRSCSPRPPCRGGQNPKDLYELMFSLIPEGEEEGLLFRYLFLMCLPPRLANLVTPLENHPMWLLANVAALLEILGS